MTTAQELCEIGSEHLVQMRYLDAIASLELAELKAMQSCDWDLLSRLYMPLQEARRQVRQRCGEGIVRLDLLAKSPLNQPDADHIAVEIPQGQLLIAGWASIEPAKRLREIARQKQLYLETFLAAVYPMGASRAIVIVPTPEVALPDASPRSIDRLIALLPPHAIVLDERELPAGPRPGSPRTYAETMALWERLHQPFLAAADMRVDPFQRIQGYRAAIAVDYACELAHQKLSAVAHEMTRAAAMDA